MARVDGVSGDTRNPFLRLLFWGVQRRLGPVVALRGYALSGAVLGGSTGLELGIERVRHVDRRLAGLAELRVAALVGCPFCLDIGSALVSRLGATESQLRELNDHPRSLAFSPLEKRVLAYTDAMTRTPVEIADADVAALRADLGEPALVELTAAIAHENLRARMNHALGYGAQGFSEGGVCALAAPAAG
jgi:AhpD family alkylhydroperoxidase